MKRPRKDDWDKDSEDEIISAYCTHNGDISIPMNPGGKYQSFRIGLGIFIFSRFKGALWRPKTGQKVPSYLVTVVF